MATLLHIDASARLDRSHTRTLSKRFVDSWLEQRPNDRVIVRDVGLLPPAPVTQDWIAAAFTKPERRDAAMWEALEESERLVDELESADLIVAGVPMYNFGMPAPMKAYIDNLVRVGRTFGFDRNRQGEPYWPMLHGKRLVILSARGDYGYEPGERLAHMNHVEPHLRSVFAYLGVTEVHSLAVEYDEFADERVRQSLQRAQTAVQRLAVELAGRYAPQARMAVSG